ncbi:MAG: hypothetical protein WBW94_06565 [Anaerolineales bacterium]
MIATYIWFISFGSWTNWPAPPFSQSSRYFYDQLATAFQHGQLSLDKMPSAALLALHNPYNPSARAGLDYVTDFSLYNGKYYLYFGPVPALLLIIIKLLAPVKIDDLYLVFIFVSGILIAQSLLIIKIRERFFQNVPTWMVPCCILFAGLISPFTWLLTEARVYEAASAGGQFFFLTGLYLVITASDRESISSKRLFLGGTFWALAIGSRLTQIVPIGFMTLMVALLTLRTYRQPKLLSKTISIIASLASPIVIGLAILGWYNWARFHSVFETGYSYALTGPNLQQYKDVIFAPIYLLPNLYNYLIMPPKIIGVFPFMKSVTGNGASIFSFINLPDIYVARQVTGLFFNVPFILFSAILVVPFLLVKKELKDEISRDNDSYLFKWTAISLFGSFLFGFAPLVVYFWVVTRFFTDFTSSLVSLSILGFCQGYVFLIDRPIRRTLYVTAGISLMIISIIVSNLLALSTHATEFQKFNPFLWHYLANLFSK